MEDTSWATHSFALLCCFFSFTINISNKPETAQAFFFFAFFLKGSLLTTFSPPFYFVWMASDYLGKTILRTMQTFNNTTLVTLPTGLWPKTQLIQTTFCSPANVMLYRMDSVAILNFVYKFKEGLWLNMCIFRLYYKNALSS